MLERQDDWVWDSWYVVEGDTLHAFYLTAPRSLGNPDLRHVNARVGHSVSSDGINWTHLEDALAPQITHTFDNQAIWTGSIVRAYDKWHLFFTGINTTTLTTLQAIGHAISDDLTNWKRVSEEPILNAVAPYGLLGNPHDGAQHFRDPWVFSHDNTWNMFVTASDEDGWGTIALATSDDLNSWKLHEPMVTNSLFKQLEVTETAEIDGEWFLFFCAGPNDVHRPGIQKGFGTYCVPAEGPVGPFDFDRTTLVAEGIYAARAVQFKGKWVLLGFEDTGMPGDFTGRICDPKELTKSADGHIRIL